MPHVPLFRSPAFEDHSRRGLYGDVVEEVDWSVGLILETLRDNGLSQDTCVVFTSDNGPWLSQKDHGGSAGLLREGKGTTWEGGMRGPTIMWWPGTIQANAITSALGCTTDLLATFAALSGAELPQDRELDSYDLSQVLRGDPSTPADGPRNVLFYYRGYELMAVRWGAWKVHYQTQGSYGTEPKKLTKCEPPELYHLEHDPSELYNIANAHPQVLEAIGRLVEEHQQRLDPAPSQLEH